MEVIALIPDELRKRFSEFFNDETSRIEVEIRFGFFSDGKFNSKLIDSSLYRNVKEHLDNLQKRHPEVISKNEINRTVECSDSGIRKITEISRVYYQQKVKDLWYDNFDWGIRFVKSRELDIEEPVHFVPTISRQYHRITYIDNRRGSNFYGLKVDLSEVIVDGKCQYELELEAIFDKLSIDELSSVVKWWSVIKTIYGWTLNAMDSEQIISLKERFTVAKTLSETLSGKADMLLNPGLVNRPTTLMKVSDVYNRAISFKIDGEHKLLLFCKYGVYACSNPLNIIKIGDAIDNNVTILECEYLSSQKQYFAFDILVYECREITQMNFTDRYNYLKNFVAKAKLKLKHGVISPKTFYFPEDHVDIINLYNNSTLPLDGIIFQSLGSYNNKIYKWKPNDKLTVDFYLQSDLSGQIIPCVLRSNTYFKMDYSVSINMPLDDLNRKVVECQWEPEKNHWIPLRVRFDKPLPNAYKVAMSTIQMLNTPISLQDIVQARRQVLAQAV